MHVPIHYSDAVLAIQDSFMLPDTNSGALLLFGVLCFVEGLLAPAAAWELRDAGVCWARRDQVPSHSLGTEPATCNCVMKLF